MKAIVIGASSGIGRALAKLLSEKGYEIGITARRVERLEALQKEIPGKSFVRKMDLKDPDASVTVLQDLIQEMKGMDLIILNSGVNEMTPGFEWEKDKVTLGVNVMGFVALANAAGDYFLKQKSGHLVGISSIAGVRGSGRAPAYCASKACVATYMEGIHHRLVGEGIRVTDVRPGFVDTPMVHQAGRKLFWVISPEQAAGDIWDAISNKKRVIYTPKRWRFVAWMMRLMPTFLYTKINQRLKRW